MKIPRRLPRRLPRGPQARRWLAAIAVTAIALVVGYYAWLRDSSLVAVEEVKILGASTATKKLSNALARASAGMTTLNVDESELIAAASEFPSVRAISVDAKIPNTLEITIYERIPLGFIEQGADRVPVSADGFAIPGLDIPVEVEPLPRIDATAGAGGRLDDDGRAITAAIGAAPKDLRERIKRGSVDRELGLVLRLRGGPEVRMGESGRLRLKWRAAELVLDDPGVGSPSYLDVSVPDRPVTG